MIGQGANSAIEDGIAIADLIANSSGNITDCLSKYELLRRDRTKRFQEHSRVHSRRKDMDNPFYRHIPLRLDRPGTYDYDTHRSALDISSL